MTLKAKVLPGGLEAKPCNPHLRKFNELEWKEFDKTNPPLPLTTKCTEGLIIECNKVWQAKKPTFDKWFIIDEDEKDFYSEFGANFRQALEPVAPISEKEIDFTEFQVQLRCCLIIKDGFDNNWMKDFYEDFMEDFGIKLTVKEWAEDFFQEVSLKTHSYCLVSKVGGEPVVEQSASVERAADNYVSSMANGYSDFVKLEQKISFKAGAQWQQSQSQQEWIDIIIGLQKEYAAEIDLEMLTQKGIANNEIRISTLDTLLKILHNEK